MGRSRRLSVDGACVSAADSLEAATRIALAVAEAAILARVDTVVVHIGASTESGFLRGSNERGRNAAFLARVLQYLETPPCLRRALVPAHADLAMVGSLPSESRVEFMPHHLRAHREEAPFREGVVVAKHARGDETWPRKPRGHDGTPPKSTLAHVGLERLVRIDRAVRPGVRVTLAAPSEDSEPWRVAGRAEARNKNDGFWGFDVFVAEGGVPDAGNSGAWHESGTVKVRIDEEESRRNERYS